MTGDDLGTRLGPGAEFDLIRRFSAEWGEAAAALGDDAATLPLAPGMQLVVSTDTCVENVHFRRTWLTPAEIGWRAASAALSDLAAMAAKPLGVLCALTLPPSWQDDAVAIAAGFGDAVADAGTRIVGGDITSGSELSLCVTVIGSAARPLARADAVPGDLVYVTGRLGGPGAALRAWETRRKPASAHRERFARPRARLREAVWLAEHGARAAIDVSDGLVGDLGHIAAAGGVRIEVDLDRVPCVEGVSAEEAASSGEEYELLVATPRLLSARAFASEFGLELTSVGRVTGQTGGGEVIALHRGVRVDPPPGHDHLST